MAGTASSVINRLIQNAARLKPAPHHHPSASSPPTTAILRHLNSGNLDGALSVLQSTHRPFPPSVYSRLLLLCSSRRALVAARRVESHLTASSPDPSLFLLNRAIETLSTCGSIADARQLFDEIPDRDGGSWNAIITAHSRADQPKEALSLFSKMKNSGIRPKEVTFASVLSSCAELQNLPFARQVHSLILRDGYCSNVILVTSIIDVYGKCLVIEDARKAFELMENRSVVTWYVIVRRYLEVGRWENVIAMLFRMIREGGVPPSGSIASSALVACWNGGVIRAGRMIHGFVVKVGLVGEDAVEISLLNMYAKCGLLDDARKLFDQSTTKDVVRWTSIVSGYAACGRIGEAEELFNKMPEWSVVSWNAMLTGYVRFLHFERALEFFSWMQCETREADAITVGLVLNATAGLSDLEIGKQAHGFAYRHGFESNSFFSNALVDMYAKCGSLRSATLWFLWMGSQRDRISWNSLLSGYACNRRSEEALDIFAKMLRETSPNEYTFTVMLAACANVFMIGHGKQIHGYMIRNGFEMDAKLRGALIDMYSKCRVIDYAIKVFEEDRSRDTILWNQIMLGCAYNGRGEHALDLFEAMKRESIGVDNVTFTGVLLSCISEGYVDLGRQYFDLMSKEYGVIPRTEHYECMIELLCKHGFMVELEEFIQKMPFEPTIPMWTRIFDCCREHGNRRLGERAASCINESDPLVPVRFELFADSGCS